TTSSTALAWQPVTFLPPRASLELVDPPERSVAAPWENPQARAKYDWDTPSICITWDLTGKRSMMGLSAGAGFVSVFFLCFLFLRRHPSLSFFLFRALVVRPAVPPLPSFFFLPPSLFSFLPP